MGHANLCRGPELNWRHVILQTIALPTELPRRDFPSNLQLTTTGSEPNAMVRYTIIPFRGRRMPNSRAVAQVAPQSTSSQATAEVHQGELLHGRVIRSSTRECRR